MSKKPVFRKVLVANDKLEGLELALPKAAMIEHYSGAAVEVLGVLYDTIAEEPDTILPAAERANLIEGLKAAERNGLKRLIEPYEGKVADISARVLWEKNAATGILSQLEGVDFLIKPISRHQSVIDRLHAPLDWALTRSAPCPVLISKKAWPDPNVVLAALDAGDESHQTLNRAILATAADMSRILGCDLQVVCAYPSLGQSVNDLQVAMDYDGIKADMRGDPQPADRRLDRGAGCAGQRSPPPGRPCQGCDPGPGQRNERRPHGARHRGPTRTLTTDSRQHGGGHHRLPRRRPGHHPRAGLAAC